MDISHVKILREFEAVGSRDYMTLRFDFMRRFRTSVPGNGVWKGSVTHPVRDLHNLQ